MYTFHTKSITTHTGKENLLLNFTDTLKVVQKFTEVLPKQLKYNQRLHLYTDLHK